MALDLNNPFDYARATSGDASRILQQFNKSDDKWDLLEAGYVSDQKNLQALSLGTIKPVLFHIFETKANFNASVPQVQDSGGRRKAVYMLPFQDGQTTTDIGRMGDSFSIEGTIFGKNYKAAFEALLKELNKPTPGILIHPVRGRVPVAFKDYRLTHSSDASFAVAFSLQFIEHNYSILSDGTSLSKKSSVKEGISKTLGGIQSFTNLANSVESKISGVRTLKNQIESLINSAQGKYTSNLGNINTTFNGGSNSDIPGLLPVKQGGVDPITGLYPVGTSISDPFLQVPTTELATAQTTAIASEGIKKNIDSLRQETEVFLLQCQALDGGQGALTLYDEILDVKTAMILLQETYEAGVRSSRANIVEYIPTRVMSIREIAFFNNVSPDRAFEIALLNPEIESVNDIQPGYAVKVPVS